MANNIIAFPNSYAGTPEETPEQAPEPLTIRIRVVGPESPLPETRAAASGLGLAYAALCGVISFVVVSAALGGL